jgi:hypothetical protein
MDSGQAGARKSMSIMLVQTFLSQILLIKYIGKNNEKLILRSKIRQFLENKS